MIHAHTMRSTPDSRVGRTARWPASVGWVRFGGRISGVIVRIGNRHAYLSVLPPARKWWPHPRGHCWRERRAEVSDGAVAVRCPHFLDPLRFERLS